MTSIPVLGGLRSIAPRYKVLICDIWGVLHNGHKAFEGVVGCLDAFRASGGTVLLLSNAPRPNAPIREQLRTLGVPGTSYDAIVTSGDLTRELLADRARTGTFPIHHVGPDRDMPLFEGLDVSRVPLGDAKAIVCTGPFDDTTEGPEDYKDYWTPALKAGTPFFCANPDLQVQRGDHLIYCAGALAQDYEARGGQVTYLGKPHLPVYDFVERHLREYTGRSPDRREWLAVGDGLRTDILGAKHAGIDALLITGGIHERELSDEALQPDPARMAAVLGPAGLSAIGAMRRLAW
jgi:HAD superfamily hydrolase (TIGR01459 family)